MEQKFHIVVDSGSYFGMCPSVQEVMDGEAWNLSGANNQQWFEFNGPPPWVHIRTFLMQRDIPEPSAALPSVLLERWGGERIDAPDEPNIVVYIWREVWHGGHCWRASVVKPFLTQPDTEEILLYSRSVC